LNIKIDSRKVVEGDIFVALGKGHEYVEEAINNGATKVVVEHGKYSVDTLVVKDTKKYLIKYLKENYYEEISDLKLIGITGTNGKTTSAYLIYQALNKAGIKCGYIGTIGFYLDDKVETLNNTTPEILDIYNMLITCKDEGCKVVVMEVSSHALDMKRVDGLLFDYAIFTNLTEEHLDFHKSIKKYFKAKLKLFKKLKTTGKAIINVDDKYGRKIKTKNLITISSYSGDYLIEDYVFSDKTKFIVNNNKYEMMLLGIYNIYNMLNAIVILDEFNVENKYKIVKKLSAPPGRMQIINYKSNKIIVDYAHTPDAVENILKSVKDFAKSKIYVIIGCGGNRDRFKRPIMARIATNLSDYVILTSDNPRDEDPDMIIDDMIKGIEKDNYQIIVNRSEAIQNGVQLLKNNDILLLLGKGHETYQIIGKEKIYFDDKNEVEKCIRR
jgi:UDP-N-acetylmuramoyl-L-alanyl-D-glutamate--2,6-diaminopimelate ligase